MIYKQTITRTDSHKDLKIKKKEMKNTKVNHCTNIIIITNFGSYITSNINYNKWEINNNFRKWLMIDEI